MNEADRLQDQGRLVAAPPEDLCLAFANSRSWRPSDQPVEKLHSFPDLVAWCQTTKALDPASADQIRQWARHNARVAASLFDEAIATRETLYRLFSATAENAQPAAPDVETLNRLLARTPGRGAVTIAAAGNRWRLPPVVPAVASLLAPVIWSAGDLLTGERLARVRLCANEKCRWLFLDDSKAGTRRWCTMRACGNRAKAHRHYLRKTKAARAQALQ